MYEKYKCNEALINIYHSYIYLNNPKIPFRSGNSYELINNLPNKENALKYLKIGVSKGKFSCIKELSEYYKNIGENGKALELIKYEDYLIMKSLFIFIPNPLGLLSR